MSSIAIHKISGIIQKRKWFMCIRRPRKNTNTAENNGSFVININNTQNGSNITENSETVPKNSRRATVNNGLGSGINISGNGNIINGSGINNTVNNSNISDSATLKTQKTTTSNSAASNYAEDNRNNTQTGENENKESIWEKPFIQFIIAPIIVVIVTIILNLIVTIWQTNHVKSEINDSIMLLSLQMDNNLMDTNNRFDIIDENITLLDERITSLDDRVTSIEIALEDNSILVEPMPFLVACSNDLTSSAPTIKQGTPISFSKPVAKNITTGEEIQGNSLIGLTITFYYTDTETNELVFFKGQYDENGLWDKNCIVNKYRDGELTMIMNARYDKGTLVSYKMVQAIVNDKDNNGDNINDALWSVSERKVKDGVNVGETWTYFREEPYFMKFDAESFVGEDIITKDEFCNEMLQNLSLEGYYHGNTSNGAYNDESGEACMVKYTPDGYIRTFYVGNVVNGVLSDSTGKAWYVALTHDGEHYTYHVGTFSNDSADSDIPNYKNQEEIDEIVAGYGFNYEPNWKQFD